jgi:hypothetical protein
LQVGSGGSFILSYFLLPASILNARLSNYNRALATNGLKERADFLEQCLFSELQDAVPRPEAIDRAFRVALDGRIRACTPLGVVVFLE